MRIRSRLGAALGAGILTFGIAGLVLASSQDVQRRPGGLATVDQQSCGIEPLDVELIIDTSGSMGSNSSNGKTRLQWAQISAKQLVDELDASGLNVGGSGHRVGVTRFSGTTASVVVSLGDADNASDVKAAIDTLSSNGNTPLDAGMATGAADLSSNARAGVQQVVILLSDGRPWEDQGPNGTWASTTSKARPTAAEGAAYLGSADVAISVALGQGGTSGTANEVDLALMALIGPDGAYHVVNGNELPDVFANIYEQIACPPPHLVAAKAVDKDTAEPGDTLNYTISLSNDGGSDATGVDVHDDIAALLAHGTFGSCDNGCTHDADSVDWSGLTVQKNGSIDLHFSIDLAMDGWDVGTTHLPNTVVVPESNCKADSDDADCSVDTTVTVEPVVTEAPVTEPPATEPPATEPPATEPPATEPPATEAPSPSFVETERPATNLPTLPNTSGLAGSGPSHPADGAWLLVVALGVAMGTFVVLTPAPGRRRRR